MFKDLSKKIEDLTIELAEIRSVVGTKEEKNVVDKVYDKFMSMDYYKKHPEMLKFVDVLDDPLERKSVLAILKGEKGKNNKTIVLIGHTDTVGVSDYGVLQEYATSPLELAEKFKDNFMPHDARKDLESGGYIFGRGVFDMNHEFKLAANVVSDDVLDLGDVAKLYQYIRGGIASFEEKE